jgi:hypothetical protein
MYVNEVKAVRGGYVHVVNIGQTLIYSAWEPDHGYFVSKHGTITHLDVNDQSVFCGRVSTERDPCDLPAWSVERYNYCRAKQGRLDARAYAMIVEAYPEARHGRKTMGEIEVQMPTIVEAVDPLIAFAS